VTETINQAEGSKQSSLFKWTV